MLSTDKINEICVKFRIDWEANPSPQISKYLDGHSPNEQSQLVSRIVPLDIEIRKEHGESPSPADYAILGPEAIQVARRYTAPSNGSDSVSEAANGDDSATLISDNNSFANSLQSSIQLDGETMPGLDGDGNFDCEFIGESTGMADGSTMCDSAFDHDDEPPTRQIGRYRLRRRIGQGGMGSVWLAEQEEPVKRTVALKVVRAGLDSKNMVARFEAERQAIAMMDHQNIARILDAGTTEDGHPFFVMELVRGIPLNRYCDKHRLSIRERLKLLVPVCRAVQHAHQKGIIHRDLKHSNVLVSESDGEPVPKVIDFGLAKALGHQHTLTDKTMFTEIGRVVGTLQYMSPEQSETNNPDIDTRTDVYSLGVMLYKLLTGTTPLQDQTATRISLLEALETIREKDPVKPSVRLLEKEDSIDEVADNRRVNPERLRQMVQGDLDSIVMKALEKDRKERYETANGLAMDIERYLNDERVRARPHSAMYGFKKFVKRNRGLVASIAAMLALLLFGIVATSVATVWAMTERDRANQKTILANRESKLARKAELAARESAKLAKEVQQREHIQLQAMWMKTAWSNWQLGDIESAWQMLNLVQTANEGWEHRYLRTELTASEHTLYGHARPIKTMDLSNDGKFLLTGSMADSIKLWDVKTRELLKTFHVTNATTGVRFSPDSKQFLCVDRANRVSIWNTETGALIREFGPFANDLTAVDFSPDGTRLVLGTAKNDTIRVAADRVTQSTSTPSILVLDAAQGTILHELKVHTDDVFAVAWHPTEEAFVSCSKDSSILKWHLNDQQEFEVAWKLGEPGRPVNDIAISNSGDRLVSCGEEMIRIWEFSSGRLFRTLTGHKRTVNSVAFSKDDKRIVSTSADGTAIVWSIEGKPLLTCQGHFDGTTDAKFTVDGDRIVTVSDDSTARIWDSRVNASSTSLKVHADTVWCVDFSPDDQTVVSVSEDGTHALIDARTGKLIVKRKSLGTAMLTVTYSPNGHRIVIGCEDGKLRIFDDQLKLLDTIDAHTNFIWDVSFSPDGQFLASASADKTAKIWNSKDWNLHKTLVEHGSEVASFRYSSDGSKVVTGSDDKSVRIWDAKTFDLIQEFKGHRNTIWRAIFSPDGNLVASCSYDGAIIIWDLVKNERIQTIKAHTDQTAGLAFSADGTRLISASDDRSLKVWDVESGFELMVFRDEEVLVHTSFSNDGSRLVTGNGDGLITFRYADQFEDNSPHFLPQDAVSLTNDGLLNVHAKDATVQVFEHEYEIAKKCCRYFPSYETFTIRGICQYRLGQFQDAVTSLREALRLEIIQYNQPDQRPSIEGYLALALWKVGHEKQAKEFQMRFNKKTESDFWVEDEIVQRLKREVAGTFQSDVAD